MRSLEPIRAWYVLCRLAATAIGPAALAAETEAAKPLGGVVSEVKGGVHYHDLGLFRRSRESGADINLEALFVSPGFSSAMWSPRPHLGFSINTSADTNQVYGGLTWDWTLWRGLYMALSLGLSLHDGPLQGDRATEKQLGLRLLFREAIELGWRFDARHSLSVIYDHISNAGINHDNDGLETIGLRHGFRF